MVTADLDGVPHRRPVVSGLRGGEPAAPKAIGYFSPEFGITEVLPQYSGGLGILAGDHLKAASDLGVPIIGVGLLYRGGYFRQSLNQAGWQQERYPLLDPNSLLTQLHGGEGPVRIEVRWPTDPVRPSLAGPGRPGAAAAARLRLWSRTPATSGRSDRLRRRHRPPAGPGGAARDRHPGDPGVLCDHRGAGARGVPPTKDAGFLGWRRIREYRSERGWTSTRPWSAAGRAPCSPPIPRCRPASTGSPRADREPVRRLRQRCRWTGSWPSARRTTRAATEQVQHGRDGLPARSTGQWRVGAARRGLPGHVPGTVVGLRHQRGPITSITNGVHHLTWVHRELLDLLEAPTGSSAETVIDGYDWNALAGSTATLWA